MADERVIWITGASAGIGAATARLAAASGWRLVLAARSLDKLTALADELGGPARAIAVECDVTSWSDQQAALTVALEHFGRLDAAWANAGFGGERSFLGGTPEHWRDMVLTNVYGAARRLHSTNRCASMTSLARFSTRSSNRRMSTSTRSSCARPRRSCSSVLHGVTEILDRDTLVRHTPKRCEADRPGGGSSDCLRHPDVH